MALVYKIHIQGGSGKTTLSFPHNHLYISSCFTSECNFQHLRRDGYLGVVLCYHRHLVCVLPGVCRPQQWHPYTSFLFLYTRYLICISSFANWYINSRFTAQEGFSPFHPCIIRFSAKPWEEAKEQTSQLVAGLPRWRCAFRRCQRTFSPG